VILMYKIGVIGGRDTVIGFKALGLDTFPVDTPDDAKRIMRSLITQESPYAIIYLEESFAHALKAEIAKVKDQPRPAIIMIPGRDGTLGLGMDALRESVDKAVGVAII